MIQMGGLSTFSPRAALKIRSFFNGAKGMGVVEKTLEQASGQIILAGVWQEARVSPCAAISGS